jgi:hypothetical protein
MFEDAAAFLNVNTPDDLLGWRRRGWDVMTGFDTIIVADWSARSTPSPARPGKDAIFLGICRDGYVATLYQRTRFQAMRSLVGLIDGESCGRGGASLRRSTFPSPIRAGSRRAVRERRSAEPVGGISREWSRMTTATATTGSRSPRGSTVSSTGRAVLGPSGRLRDRGPAVSQTRLCPFPLRREAPDRNARAPGQVLFQLMGAGSVGSQALLGIARLQGLRGSATAMRSRSRRSRRRKPRWFWPSAIRACWPTGDRRPHTRAARSRTARRCVSWPTRFSRLPAGPPGPAAGGRRPDRGLDPRPWRAGRDRRRAALRPIAGRKTRLHPRRPLRSARAAWRS